jgi:transcriptional regulator with XRE-family HTH domain
MAAPAPVNKPVADKPEPLWREALGERLRQLRLERGERLVDTAARAGVSPQYLSEVERGHKDASSEMIAAIAGALGLTVLDLVSDVVGAAPVRVEAGRAAASVRATYSLAA